MRWHSDCSAQMRLRRMPTATSCRLRQCRRIRFKDRSWLMHRRPALLSHHLLHPSLHSNRLRHHLCRRKRHCRAHYQPRDQGQTPPQLRCLRLRQMALRRRCLHFPTHSPPHPKAELPHNLWRHKIILFHGLVSHWHSSSRLLQLPGWCGDGGHKTNRQWQYKHLFCILRQSQNLHCCQCPPIRLWCLILWQCE